MAFLSKTSLKDVMLRCYVDMVMLVLRYYLSWLWNYWVEKSGGRVTFAPPPHSALRRLTFRRLLYGGGFCCWSVYVWWCYCCISLDWTNSHAYELHFSKKFALNGNSMVMIVLLTHGALRSLVERLALNEVSGNFYFSSATNQINCHSERSIAVSFRNTCRQL